MACRPFPSPSSLDSSVQYAFIGGDHTERTRQVFFAMIMQYKLDFSVLRSFLEPFFPRTSKWICLLVIRTFSLNKVRIVFIHDFVSVLD